MKRRKEFLRFNILVAIAGTITTHILAQNVIVHDLKGIKLEYPVFTHIDDSTFLVASSVSSINRNNGTTQNSISLRWIDTNGSSLQERNYFMEERTWPIAINYQKEVSTIFLAVQSYSQVEGSRYELMRISKEGTITWKYRAAGSGSVPSIGEKGGIIIFTLTNMDNQTLLVCLSGDGKEQWDKPLEGYDGSIRNNTNVIEIGGTKIGILLQANKPSALQGAQSPYPSEYFWYVCDSVGTIESKTQINSLGWIVALEWYNGELNFIERIVDSESSLFASRFVLVTENKVRRDLFQMSSGLWYANIVLGNYLYTVFATNGKLRLICFDSSLKKVKEISIDEKYGKMNSFSLDRAKFDAIITIGLDTSGHATCKLLSLSEQDLHP